MTLTVEIDPARRTAAFREVSYLAAGDSCRVVLDGVRGADFGSLALLLYRDAASESPVASCSPFAPVRGHPSLADGELALDTAEMAAWFADAVPEESDDSDDDDALPRASASAEPRLAARASLAERSVRADGWLVVLDRDRTWAACRVPVLLRPGAAGHGATDPTSIRALVEGLVSTALADKADKVPSAAAGNLASLDSSGNLADSGATPASIKAAAVAEVVANAPGTMDTLKEIADILGSSQQTGTVLKRILDLEGGKVDKEAGKGLVAVDATLAVQGAAADAKAAGDALDGKRGLKDLTVYDDETVFALSSRGGEMGVMVRSDDGWSLDLGSGDYWSLSYGDALWTLGYDVEGAQGQYATGGNEDASTISFDGGLYTVTRSSVVSPTLDTLARDSQIPTASTATPQMDSGNGSAGGENTATFSKSDHVHPSDASKANAADLRYRLVEPGKWEFSGSGYDPSITYRMSWDAEQEEWLLEYYEGDENPWILVETKQGEQDDLVVDFDGNAITATRPSLPGHLCDRAGNRVVVSGDTTLTLPAAVPGYARDFLVRLEISGSTVPTITFAAPTGETITYETDGDEFPVPDDGGVWLYAFTETKAHTFAVALKSVTTVTQGGS